MPERIMCKSSLQRADSGKNRGSSPVLEVGSLHNVCLAALPLTNNCFPFYSFLMKLFIMVDVRDRY